MFVLAKKQQYLALHYSSYYRVYGQQVCSSRLCASQSGNWLTVYFDDSREWTDYVDLPTSDDKLIRAYNFTVIDNEGKLYINSLNGYLFEK